MDQCTPEIKSPPASTDAGGASHSKLLLFYIGRIIAQSNEGFWKLPSRRTPAAGTNLE